MGFFSKFGAWIIGICVAIGAAIVSIFVAYQKGQSAEAGKVDAETLKKTQADQKTSNSIESQIAQLPPSAKSGVTVPASFPAASPEPTVTVPTPGFGTVTVPVALSEADPNSAAGRLNALTQGNQT